MQNSLKCGLLILLFNATFGWSANSCQMAVQQHLSFGSYNPLNKQPQTSRGHFTVKCFGLAHYHLSISGTRKVRKRTLHHQFHQKNILYYNLFTSPQYSKVWRSELGHASQQTFSLKHFYIYGLIYPNQLTALPGPYSDQLYLTIDF